MAEAVDEKSERRDGKVTVSRCMEFRINPTMEQKTLIWKTFGCCRFVWNNLLQERIEYEKINKGKLLNTTPAHLKKNNPFLCEVDSLSLSNTQLDLNMSCRLLFAKGRRPKFRRKGRTRGHIPPTGRTTTSRLFTKVIERTTSSFRNWEECASYSTVAYRMSGG